MNIPAAQDSILIGRTTNKNIIQAQCCTLSKFHVESNTKCNGRRSAFRTQNRNPQNMLYTNRTGSGETLSDTIRCLLLFYIDNHIFENLNERNLTMVPFVKVPPDSLKRRKHIFVATSAQLRSVSSSEWASKDM